MGFEVKLGHYDNDDNDFRLLFTLFYELFIFKVYQVTVPIKYLSHKSHVF